MLASKLPSASRRVMDKEEQLGAITHLSTAGVEAQVKLVPDRLVNSIDTVGMGVGATLGAIVGTAVGSRVRVGDAVGWGEEHADAPTPDVLPAAHDGQIATLPRE